MIYHTVLCLVHKFLVFLPAWRTDVGLFVIVMVIVRNSLAAAVVIVIVVVEVFKFKSYCDLLYEH